MILDYFNVFTLIILVLDDGIQKSIMKLPNKIENEKSVRILEVIMQKILII